MSLDEQIQWIVRAACRQVHRRITKALFITSLAMSTYRKSPFCKVMAHSYAAASLAEIPLK